MLVLQLGPALLSSIHQRKGRTGYYITVATPKSLRNKLGNSIRRKVGNTHREALANRSKIETEIQRQIGKELNQLSVVEEVQEIYQEKTLSDLPTSEKEQLKNIYQVDFDKEGNPTTPEEVALWEELDGKTTYHQWINKRKIIEGVTKSTVNGWHTKLSKLAKWNGTDYLGGLTKAQARKFKDYLIQQGHELSSVKNIIGTLNAFWNWGIENEIVEINIWSGLKKRLPDAEKKELPPRGILDKATDKASTITPLRKEKDYAFLIQRYTACRKGAANGLRHCDINLNKKTITFKAWEKIVSYEKKRGGKIREKQIRRLKSPKDERTVPISKALYEHLKEMPLIKGSDDPIWPNRYKNSDDSWGHHHCNEFRNKYGLPSHDLRRFGITALINEGVSPYRIWDVVRHKIPGMSEVTMMYNRPTTEDLIETMEVIAK